MIYLNPFFDLLLHQPLILLSTPERIHVALHYMIIQVSQLSSHLHLCRLQRSILNCLRLCLSQFLPHKHLNLFLPDPHVPESPDCRPFNLLFNLLILFIYTYITINAVINPSKWEKVCKACQKMLTADLVIGVAECPVRWLLRVSCDYCVYRGVWGQEGFEEGGRVAGLYVDEELVKVHQVEEG
jgi:hypothetical protein